MRSIYQDQKNNQSQKDDHQDNLLFACLQFFKHNCLNLFADNVWSQKQVKG